MASKHLYFQICFRVILLLLTSLLIAYLLIKEEFTLGAYIAILLLIQTLLLIRFLNKTNRKMAYFFNAIENNDSTIHFPSDINNASIRELNSSLNRVNNLLQKAKIDIKEQEQYYHTILEEAETGILVLHETGHIALSNKTAKQLLNHEHLTHVQQLQPLSEKLFQTLQKFQAFNQKLIQIPNERESIHLTVKASELSIGGKKLLLVVIQNIHKELDNQEIESWQRLIRVLTHEIMNSVAPITSISETLLGYFKKDKESTESKVISKEKIQQTVKALDTIHYQGNNLMKFTHSYRALTTIPKPDKKLLAIMPLLETVRMLVSQDEGIANIKFNLSVSPNELEVFADEKLITLVLLNLVKNAIESLKTARVNGLIGIKASKDSKGVITIEVNDNGPGIASKALEQIFIPFYTSKKNGSGIGLSLSRHIMRLHQGNLEVSSTEQIKTSFKLKFQPGLSA